ncbi:MAG: hypothetical protein HY294_16520 [Candidatus Rokubacteria bacterium]|nr:hypothetical protein [Candidatus Rokubacteria bacterium]
MLVLALINIHHFVVDACIWKLRRDPNYQTGVGGRPRPVVRAGSPRYNPGTGG